MYNILIIKTRPTIILQGALNCPGNKNLDFLFAISLLLFFERFFAYAQNDKSTFKLKIIWLTLNISF